MVGLGVKELSTILSLDLVLLAILLLSSIIALGVSFICTIETTSLCQLIRTHSFDETASSQCPVLVYPISCSVFMISVSLNKLAPSPPQLKSTQKPQ